MKNAVIIGIGLIGGSLARDIRKLYDSITILGMDCNKAHIKKAIALGLIDQEATDIDLQRAELVVLSIPVDATVIELPKILNIISDGCLVIDVGSTKQNICMAVANHKNRRNFLATHPIAGTEFTGTQAAKEGLFSKKTNIICQVEYTAFNLQERALKLFSDLGMIVRYMNPEAHDKHIAYVSHLSHISSFMLGKTVMEKEKNERDIFDLAGSGFESTVRLAKSSPEMWTPIFKQNKQNVVETLTEYIQNLKTFKNHMVNDDFEAILNEMKHTNHIKSILNGISKPHNI